MCLLGLHLYKFEKLVLRLCVGPEEVVVEDIGAAEVVYADPAKMTIKDSGAAEVVHADDAETSLKDSGKSETMLTDVSTRIAPEEVSKAGSETVCGDPEEVMVEGSLENKSGSEEVVVEAGVEESKAVDVKDSVPGHEGTQDVAFAISDCRGVSELRISICLLGRREMQCKWEMWRRQLQMVEIQG